ncbi:MAG: Gfo/Idh/MocA family oxidoreductase, partial [Raoultibacter sp.]
MDKLKVCIVGAGQESRASHIPNLQRLTDMAELTALCDINEAAARDAAEKYGIARYYGSHIAMLETEKPDMVTV